MLDSGRFNLQANTDKIQPGYNLFGKQNNNYLCPHGSLNTPQNLIRVNLSRFWVTSMDIWVMLINLKCLHCIIICTTLSWRIERLESGFQLNSHCKARSCIWPQPYDPDFDLSMLDLFGIGHESNFFMAYTEQVWHGDQNLGRKVEVIYMDVPCNAC